MKKEMLINVLQPEECRIAILENGVLEELYVERESQDSYVGNIYKGRIVNIEPSIQAAFVDFGIGRNAFLHVSDVDPVYYKHLLPKEVRDAMDEDAEDAPRSRDRGGRGGDRGGRSSGGGGGGRGERGDRGERGGRFEDNRSRVVRPESVVTTPSVPAAPKPPIEPVGFVDDADEFGFGTGVLEPVPADFTEPTTPEVPPTPEPESAEFNPIPTPPAPPPLPKPAPAPVPRAEPIDPFESGFGEGLLDDAPPLPKEIPAPDESARLSVEEFAAEIIGEQTPIEETDSGEDDFGRPAPIGDEPKVEPEVEDVPTVEAVEAVETTALAEEPEKPTKPRARGRAKPKAKEPAEGDDAAEPEAKAKAKPRARGKKRPTDDTTAEPNGELPPDAEPRTITGAERRTSPSDEPEIQPFFDGASDDFDIDAPNDRFQNEDEGEGGFEESEEAAGFTEEAEAPASGDEVEAGEMFEADTDEEETGAEPLEAEAPAFARRGPAPASMDEDDEFGPSPNFNRGGGGGRGGRGNRDRDNRDNRDRGRPRRGPGGPSNGGRPPARDRGYPRPPIQEIFKRGQEVIVQVIKEGIGTKGPTLSTFISIAGRYLVLMPSLPRVGVSRKIEDPEARRRLRDIMNGLNPPKGVGFIVRTAAIEQNEADLANDLQYLLRLWEVVVRRIKRMASPVEIYRESDIITRTIRDILTPDIDTIWVDQEHAFATASDFLQVVMPKFASRIRYYGDTEPLFHKYGVEGEISRINQKRIELPQGGSIIIEQTEALVAIDVNSGTFRADNNAEETAYRMNMLAAKEIARQLRLRDLGGVIVNDFIDMKSETHRRKVEDTLRDSLRRDRARTKILRISQFGIIEMTRQRIQPSLKKRVYNDCPHCSGTGYIKTHETMGIEVMRLLQLAAHRAPIVAEVAVTVHNDVAYYLLNRKRKEIAALEDRAKITIQINGVMGVSPELCDYKCFDANGGEVRLFGGPPPRMFRGNPPPRAIPERRYPQPLD